MNSHAAYAVDGAEVLMPDPSEIPSNLGILGSLGAGAAALTWWGINLALKKFGLTSLSASDANQAAQKDMLDWQREQLKDEVQRREKAEAQVQTLLEKLNEVTTQMSRMEAQNQKLQEQVQTLTSTVDQLKTKMVGAGVNAP
jgi:septal ring factor EnvC (AmiA/AmiB activator)